MNSPATPPPLRNVTSAELQISEDEGGRSTFPQQWMDVIEKESTDPTAPRLKDDPNKRVLEWLPKGESFIIRDLSAFEREVLPRYFSAGCKFMSFIRKLYRWGFRKVEKNKPGKDGTTFLHPHFKRGDKKLCLKMRSIVKKPAAKGLEAAGAGADNSLAAAAMANHPGMGLLNMLQQQQSQQSAGMLGSANNATDASSILFMNNLLAQAQTYANNAAAAGGELNLNSAQAGGAAAQGLNRQGMFPDLNNNQLGSNFTNRNLGGLTGLITAEAATTVTGTGTGTGTGATSSLSGNLGNNNQGTQGGQGVRSGASSDMTSSDPFEVGLQLKRTEEHQQQLMNMMHSNTFTGPQGQQQGFGQQQQQQSPAGIGMCGTNNNDAVSSQGGGVGIANSNSNTNFGQTVSMLNADLELASKLMTCDPSMEPSTALELSRVFGKK